MDDLAEASDPRVRIERLEQRIEELAAQLQSCRKFALAARVAVATGGVLFLALALGVVRFDALALAAAIAALLGGIVLAGSNRSTAQEAAAQLAAAERERAALIGVIELRTVAERATLH
jgi:hypothetical protein